jgi:molybdopterin-containing oxidoreductase family membrane subunit
MSADAIIVTGLYNTQEETLAAVKKIQEKGFEVREVHSPIPSDALARALGRKKSRIGWFTLTGGIIGFFSGFALAVFTSTRWDLIVSGKPIISWIPFFVIAFEFTILFAVLGNVLGIVTQVGLPDPDYEKNYDPECSGSMYGIEVASTPEDADSLRDLLDHTGSIKKQRENL